VGLLLHEAKTMAAEMVITKMFFMGSILNFKMGEYSFSNQKYSGTLANEAC
jgi:hypothetical protein